LTLVTNNDAKRLALSSRVCSIRAILSTSLLRVDSLFELEECKPQMDSVQYEAYIDFTHNSLKIKRDASSKVFLAVTIKCIPTFQNNIQAQKHRDLFFFFLFSPPSEF
jgi:hypothetical protein